MIPPAPDEEPPETPGPLRVMVAIEPRAYRESIAYSLEGLRPDVEVEIGDPGSLGSEVRRLEPHLVLCNRPDTTRSGSVISWVEIYSSSTVGQVAEACIDGHHIKLTNLQLEDLLSILDHTQKLLRKTALNTDR